MNEQTQLSIIVAESNLAVEEGQIIISKFNQYESMAIEWKEKASHIKVTSEDQTADMQMANVGRKFLADKRIEIEKTRKGMKEESLRKGQAIDAIARFLTSLIEPTEKYLREQSDFVKIKREKEEVERARIALEVEAQRVEEERVAKSKADNEERERLRAENERLTKIAQEKQALLDKERAENEEKDRKVTEERAREDAERLKIQKEIDDIARAENEAHERLLIGNDGQKMKEFKRQLSQIQKPLFETSKYRAQLDVFTTWINKHE